MGSFTQDIRYGLRVLIKHPGFTFIAVLALALGIGANSAIFSVVDGVLLRPLPFDNSDRLVKVMVKGESGKMYNSQSYPNFEDFRKRADVFENVAAYSRSTAFLTEGDEPERMVGITADADLFPLLGVNPLLGRVFTRDEDKPNGAPVIVLSYGIWQARFNSDPNIVGKQIKLDSAQVTVVGVMPRGFKFPVEAEQVDYWLPLAGNIPAASLSSRGSVFLQIVARLKDGVPEAQAQAVITTLSRNLAAQYPDTNTGVNFALVPLHEELVGKLRTALLVLLGAVGLVLLIACANVANLLLARAAARQKEIAIRAALGASRLRVIRQLLTESVLLSLAGGGLGLLLGAWGVDLLVAASPADIPRIGEIGLDARVVAFTVGVTLLTSIVFGLAPALQASRTDLQETLKEGGRGSGEGARRNRLRGALVVSEVALSLVLLIAAGLLLQSFWRLLNVNPGFEPDKVLTANLVWSKANARDKAQQDAALQESLTRLAALPGVEAVGAIRPLPLGGNFVVYSFSFAGQPAPPPGEEPVAAYRVISADYFRAMSIPVRQGRAFNERDAPDAPPVIIVNESFVRRYFPHEEPLGKRLVVDNNDQEVQREIIGVVGDVHHAGLDEKTEPEFYIPFRQTSFNNMTIVMRTESADPASFASSLRGTIREADKTIPVYNVRTMNQLLAASVARRRFNMLLLSVFALVALLLAGIGIYGVMSYAVTQRTHEIGVRIALGAQVRDVVALILKQGMLLVVAGIALGLATAFAVTRIMSSLLFDVDAADPVTFGGVALLLAGVAFFACYLPARRATKVDPMIALRYE